MEFEIQIFLSVYNGESVLRKIARSEFHKQTIFVGEIKCYPLKRKSLCWKTDKKHYQVDDDSFRWIFCNNLEHRSLLYEIRMDLYNKTFYLDPYKVYEYWDMEFLFQFFEKDLAYIWKQIRSAYPPVFIQVQDYEEKEFALWYIRHYYKLAEMFFRDQLTKILEQKDFEPLKREENFMILYGGYMEEQSILFSSEGSRLG